MRELPLHKIFFLIVLLSVCFAGCAVERATVRETFDEADFEQTYKAGMKWLEEHPGDLDVRRMTGAAAWNMGDSTAAYRVWKRDGVALFRQYPMIGKIIFRLALDTGDLSWAEMALKEAESSFLSNDPLKQYSALIQMQKIEAIRSADLAERAVFAENLQDAHDFMIRAVALYKKDIYVARLDALQGWMAAWRHVPESAEIVKESEKKALELVFDDPFIHYVIACGYAEANQIEEAMRALKVVAQNGEALWRERAEVLLEELDNRE